MISRAAACLAGVLGGLAWLARWLLDELTDGGFATGDWGIALLWAGGVWLALAAATGGARLVRKGTVWLRLILAVSAVLLAGVAWSLVDQMIDNDVFAEGMIGVVVAALSALLYFRPDDRARRRADGHVPA